MKKFAQKNKYIIAITIVGILLLGIGVNHFRLNLPDSVVEFLYKNTISSNNENDLFNEDALYVVTTGTGAPMPDINRAGPQTIVFAGDQMLVFDSGPGSTKNIELANLGVSDINALFFTHYHSDHIGGLGELFLKRWATDGKTEPLAVYGPKGVDEVVNGFEAAYQLDKEYRIAHHGKEAMPASGFGGNPITFDVGSELTSSKVVYENGDVKVTAFNVNHEPVIPSVGYRIDYKDRSVVISGDLSYTDSLIDHAKNANLLVSEALNRDFDKWVEEATKDFDSNASQVAADIQTYHISPAEVGVWARESNVSNVLVTHILPPVPYKFLENPFLKDIRKEFDGKVKIANDGTMVIMPVSSEKINYKELMK